MKRPFFNAVLVIVLAVVLTQRSASTLPGLVLCAGGFALCFYKGKPKYRKEVMILLGIASFFVCYSYLTMHYPYGLRPYNEQRITLTFQALSEPQPRAKYTQLTVLARQIHEGPEVKPLHQKMLLRLYGDIESIEPGQYYQAEMKVFEPRGAAGKDEFDYNLYLKSERIYSLANVSSRDMSKISDGHLFLFTDKIYDLKSAIIQNMQRFMPQEALEIVRGIMWGDRMADGEVKENLTTIGASHILSVSGLHVGYVYLLVTFLLKRTKLSMRRQIFIVMAVLLIYAAMSAFAVSVLRACMMFAVLQSAKLRKKVYDPLSAISLAAILILLMNPLILFTASFQLSFVSVAGIVLFARVVSLQTGHLPLVPRSIVQTVTITVCVQLCILPILLYHFGEVSLISVFANVVIIPLAGIIVITAFFGMFLCFLPFAQPYFAFLTVQVYLLQVLAGKFALAKYAAISLGAMPLSLAVAFYIALFAVFGYFDFKKQKMQRIFALSMALCACAFVLQMAAG